VKADRYEQMTRWYPPRWRSRYGRELTALLEDTYGTAGRVPMRDRIGVARAGLVERAREAALVGNGQGPAERVRAGSLLVLCGWSAFVVGGAMFGKFTDNWYAGTPKPDRWVASASYQAVVVAGTLGCALVLLAALIVVPAFVRLVRAGGWGMVRRPVARAVVSMTVAALAFLGAVSWAHHLSWHDRNGGIHLYGALFVAVCVTAVVALVYATAAAVSVARRVELSPRTLRALGLLALGQAALMVVIFTGIVTWWAFESVRAPRVLSNGIGVAFTSSTLPPVLLVTGLLALLGLALALGGIMRIARATGSGPDPA